jgi:hypothetical protein
MIRHPLSVGAMSGPEPGLGSIEAEIAELLNWSNHDLLVAWHQLVGHWFSKRVRNSERRNVPPRC